MRIYVLDQHKVGNNDELEEKWYKLQNYLHKIYFLTLAVMAIQLSLFSLWAINHFWYDMLCEKRLMINPAVLWRLQKFCSEHWQSLWGPGDATGMSLINLWRCFIIPNIPQSSVQSIIWKWCPSLDMGWFDAGVRKPELVQLDAKSQQTKKLIHSFSKRDITCKPWSFQQSCQHLKNEHI